MTFLPVKTLSTMVLGGVLVTMASMPVNATAVKGHMVPQTSMSVMTVSAETSNKAEAMIADLGDQAISALKKTSAKAEREAEFSRLLNKHFDMNVIARFSLGRYWNQATAEQQKEYTSLFNTMVIKVYSKRFEEYTGQEFKVTGSKPAGRDDVLVNSAILPVGNGPRVSVDWRVRNGKIIDVIVEGVSMSVTQRSEFASIIQRGGGQVSALIDHLKK